MSFYYLTIRPYVYFNALAYIASRKLYQERKEREEQLNSKQDATVDFPNNNEDSMDKDLVAGGASDQGQSYDPA